MQLKEFQKTGVSFLLSNTRCLLADDMGTGKTVQTLAAIRALEGDIINVLIVCRASLVLMWGAAIPKQFEEGTYEVVYLREAKNTIELTKRFRFVVVSYHYIQKEAHAARLAKLRWNVIVADEAHAIKNWATVSKKVDGKATRRQSATVRGFRSILKGHQGKIWMLTGTPATNTAADYYPYLEICQPGLWGTFSEFRELFCIREDDFWSGHHKYVGVRPDKVPLLRRAFRKITLRRRFEEVADQLPEKIVTRIPVDVGESVRRASELVSEEFAKRLAANEEAFPEHIMAVMRQIGEAKVPVAVEYILDTSDPLVVFCCNTVVLREIEKACVAAGKKVATVTGDDSRTAKKRAEDDFQSGLLDVILLNLQAGGEGLNLQSGSQMLFVQQYWSPAVMDQATARIVRIGQKAAQVRITHLIATHTIDDNILASLKSKSEMMKTVLGDDLWKS